MTVTQLTEEVWFGDYEAPFDMANAKSIINVAHYIRDKRPYWHRLKQIDSRVLYFRIAKKDRQVFDDQYARVFFHCLDAIKSNEAFPLVTHCQMGGHRGPAAAIVAAWYFGGMKPGLLDGLLTKMEKLRPGLATRRISRRVYFHTAMEFCRNYD